MSKPKTQGGIYSATTRYSKNEGKTDPPKLQESTKPEMATIPEKKKRSIRKNWKDQIKQIKEEDIFVIFFVTLSLYPLIEGLSGFSFYVEFGYFILALGLVFLIEVPISNFFKNMKEKNFFGPSLKKKSLPWILVCFITFTIFEVGLNYYFLPTIVYSKSKIDGLKATITGEAMPSRVGNYITNIHFDWGDGSASEGKFPISHNYTHPGNYTVTMRAYDNQASKGTSGSYSTYSSVEIKKPH
jgi:PKD domain